ncbi:type II toxin-antitoxin system RelE/ParE family toxin [candidate division KSB1 bacterium]|nr:type II toxin-antitoxin system RelE/ParE family toxin [candidate division KSB1 bacterium]
MVFYKIETKIVITHGFIKKSQKTPRKEIEKAKDLKNQYKTGIK